ncbi:hypothetical protein BaRGS_00026440 [Batillaria attramentaria]|uniref:Uncharacterized protein n=1 Tax=Batillaria attramentaria TaxID=370345 RepID=A0ABD0K692_9CAEN
MVHASELVGRRRRWHPGLTQLLEGIARQALPGTATILVHRDRHVSRFTIAGNVPTEPRTCTVAPTAGLADRTTVFHLEVRFPAVVPISNAPSPAYTRASTIAPPATIGRPANVLGCGVPGDADLPPREVAGGAAALVSLLVARGRGRAVSGVAAAWHLERIRYAPVHHLEVPVFALAPVTRVTEAFVYAEHTALISCLIAVARVPEIKITGAQPIVWRGVGRGKCLARADAFRTGPRESTFVPFSAVTRVLEAGGIHFDGVVVGFNSVSSISSERAHVPISELIAGGAGTGTSLIPTVRRNTLAHATSF